MSDSALFPALPSTNRVWSVWAGRESQLSLLDRIFTCIRPRVQPLLLLDLVGEFIYGLLTVIHFQRIALVTPLERFGLRHGGWKKHMQFPTLAPAASAFATPPVLVATLPAPLLEN